MRKNDNLKTYFKVFNDLGKRKSLLWLNIYIYIYIYIYIAEMQKRKRPILCYSEFRAKALVRQTITNDPSFIAFNTNSCQTQLNMGTRFMSQKETENNLGHKFIMKMIVIVCLTSAFARNSE